MVPRIGGMNFEPGLIAEPALDVARPVDHWNGQSKSQPKLVAKHRDRVSGVTIMSCCGAARIASCALVSHVRVGLMRHVVHVSTPIVGRLSIKSLNSSLRPLNDHMRCDIILNRRIARSQLGRQPVGEATSTASPGLKR